MSMLAETRRKGKWAFNPRGLKNGGEHEKKGKSLLEKMGWNEGQGLGKSNQGRVDPITLKVKNDAKGVGFEGRSEAVLAHQDDFQSLLEDLAKSHENSAANSESNSVNVSGDDENDISNHDDSENIINANHKGQKRDRKRYHKSRGAKDATKYSNKDLEGIVGGSAKKSRQNEIKKEDNDHVDSNSLTDFDDMSARPSFSMSSSTDKVLTNDSKENEETMEDKRFSNGGDLKAYFARKMEERKSMANGSKQSTVENAEKDENKTRKSKKKKKDKKATCEEQNVPQPNDESHASKETEKDTNNDKFTSGGDMNAYFARKMEEKKLAQSKQAEDSKIQKETKESKKLKKAKKSKKDSETVEEKINLSSQEETKPPSNAQSQDKKSKKHKKSKKVSKDCEKDSIIEQTPELIEQRGVDLPTKDASLNTSSEQSNTNQSETEVREPKKSKKSKKSSKSHEEEQVKSKKRKAEFIKDQTDESNCDKPKKKKSKKDKENKNVMNECKSKREQKADENDRKKDKKLLRQENYDDVVGFKGTNILSIKGYGVK